MSRTSGDIGVSETRRLEAVLSQFPPHGRPGPRRLSQPDPDPTYPGPKDTRRVPAPEYTYAPAEPVKGRVPVQSVVDRSDLLEPTTVDIEVTTEDGTVIQILRYPQFGPYGGDPNDAAWFSDLVNSRRAICGALAPYAAARCLAGVGSW